MAELNPGSEINLQVSSIQAAGLRIQQNAQEMTNLQKQVEIEIERRGTEHGINNAISQVFIDYGDKQGRLTEQISQLSATQLFANNIAQSVASTSVGIPCCPSASGGVASYAINAFIQSGLELAKGKLQAQKETLAAHERAEVNSLQDQLLDANSKANIKTWLLRMDTLALQSQELAVLLGQEWARLAGFYSEKADIERQLKEADETLADRYFADPVHRLRMQDATIEAEMSFQEAQRWVYFTARALEYKWNRLFLHTHAGHDWSVASAFKLRNATELNAMVAAMQAFNGLLDGTTVKDDYFDWFSVREDFLGFRRFDGSGNPLKYVDPATGELVNAIEAFRRHLNRLKDAQGNIVLRFGTVREVPGGTFFRGPRFDSSGQVLSRGLYLDKIKWLKIRLPGDHTVPRSQIAGDLSYGGTSFIRNQGVGQVLDPQRPDRVTGEMTPYSTRYWYYDAAPQNPGWRFRESLGAPVQMELSDDPRIPPTVSEIDVFKERSVAATDWSLRISTIDGGETILKINELNDIEIYFYHYAVVRQ